MSLSSPQRRRRGAGLASLGALAVLLLTGTVLAVGTAVSPAADGEPPVTQPKDPEPTGSGSAVEEPSPSDGTPKVELTPEHLQWLEDVQFLITDPEREIFEALPRSYQRNAFIERFWKERDPFPDTTRNELKERWVDDLHEVRLRYGDLWEEDHRARIYLFHGEPTWHCRFWQSPRELWFYDYTDRSLYPGSDNFMRRVPLFFYQSRWDGPYWIRGLEGYVALNPPDKRRPPYTMEGNCDPEQLAIASEAIAYWAEDYREVLRRMFEPPEPPSWEWATAFRSYSTEVAAGARRMEGRLEIDYPGRYQTRTVVRGLVALPEEQVAPRGEGDRRTHDLRLEGEIVAEDLLFDSFRYRFELPVETSMVPAPDSRPDALEPAREVPLVFERFLRPGTYLLIVKVEDLNSDAVFREEREIQVPTTTGPVTTAKGRATAEWLDAAYAELSRSGETVVELVDPLGHNDQIRTGYQNLAARVEGDRVDRVTFFLDDKPLLIRTRPPYEVDLDLGTLPRERLLRVVAYDAEGHELASDEKVLNGTRERFAVRWITPRQGEKHLRSFRAQVEVDVPQGRTLDRVEILLNDEPAATLYQPPYVQTLQLSEPGQLAYLRAVAYLPDGATTESTVIVNAPDYLEEIRVRLVELYTAVVDPQGRQVLDLKEGDFRVFEDGEEQKITRFERVQDLPLSLGVLLDTSGSMEPRLEEARTAAVSFLQTAVTPRDRAAVITFNDYPSLTVPFTQNRDKLLGGLLGVEAERGTALYDSVVFSLHQFTAVPGQRAVLVLSDGADEHSRFTEDETLELAHRAGVTLYTIGLDLPKKPKSARRFLERLAEETGGRSFFVEGTGELPAIYDLILQELRSRYLLAYQSSSEEDDDAFRTVQVKVRGDGLEARTIQGYYP
jgi:Ca-activated chloride channel family protein